VLISERHPGSSRSHIRIEEEERGLLSPTRRSPLPLGGKEETKRNVNRTPNLYAERGGCWGGFLCVGRGVDRPLRAGGKRRKKNLLFSGEIGEKI